MEKYETPQQFVNENKGKLFLDGFEVVKLDSFIESEFDQEPCYKVVKFIGCPPRFYFEEVPIIMGLTPLERLPDYKDIVHHWDINFECVGVILNSKTSTELTTKD